MNRFTIIGLVVGLCVGIFIGYQAGSSASPPGGVGATPSGVPGGGAGAAPVDTFQMRIAQTQQMLARDPKNVEAWIQLGNDYFDTRQPYKAIEAYERALELRPNSPNVITDQGVMYRDTGQFDKAIANFRRASELDPKHAQSLYNLGVVYLNDLKQPKKAIEVWNQVIKIAPQSEQASQARMGIEQAKKSGG